MTRIILWSVMFAFLWGVAFAKPPEIENVMEPTDHCVAYHAQKRLFFIRTVQVVGKNCDISAEVIPEPGGRFHVEVTVPVLSFDSGEIERDRDVAKILKADIYKTMTYVSASLTEAEWQKKLSEGKFQLEGKLVIQDQPFPVESQIQLIKSEDGKLSIQGVVSTEFKQLKLAPPRLWGGLGAQVNEELNLIFKIQSDKTLGASSLLP